MTPDRESEARRLLRGFLARKEAGEEPDFEALCAAHPQLAVELRRLYEHEQATPTFTFYPDRPRAGAEAGGSDRLRAGEHIGDFRLVELLGSGGQGEVWVAEQLSLRRLVALKFILPERVSSKSRAFLAREARAGGRLSHPGIVAVHDHGETEGYAWIAMELVDGARTLRHSMDELARAGELPRDYCQRAAELIAQVADALGAAHEAGVIHRDVKPRNILITRNDQPKLTDFGLARIVDEVALSKTGDFAGTYAYMSPEQVAARRAGIDHRTDIFSLGVVAYELLSLRRPFTGDSSHQIVEQILTAEPPDLHRVSPRIPRDLAVICSKALAKARGERFQTMAELAAELRRFAAGQPILTRPPTVTRRLVRWTRKHPIGLATGATALATAALVWLVTRPPPPQPFAGPEYEPLLVTGSPDDDRSPTFVGERAMLFERREGTEAAPRIWVVDLSTSLTALPWSPQGLACAAPAVSPDGRWLAYETPASEISDEPGRNAIEVRRLDEREEAPAWPGQVHARLEREGSVGGVRWSHSARFVYTHRLGDRAFLMLHDLGDPGQPDLELALLPLDPFESAVDIPACFSPEGDRVLYAADNAFYVVALTPDGEPEPPRTLDCGTVVDPVWLDDDSLLFARQSFWEASTRLYRRSGQRSERLRGLDKQLIGGYTGLAASPDRSMLALVGRVSASTLFTNTALGELPLEYPTRYPALMPAWTPSGELVYIGDTARALRPFVLDPSSGRDRPLELDVAGLESLWPDLQIDQPEFSQNGTCLVLRAKLEPLDDVCNPQTWIVITPWPPQAGAAVAVPLGECNIAYPHVNDAGDRVVWYEEGQIVGADVVDGRLVRLGVRGSGTECPVRLTGDGELIAAPALVGSEWRIVVLAWDGTTRATSAGPGTDLRAMWLPREAGGGGAARLTYFHWDEGDPERWTIRSITAADPLGWSDLDSMPVPDENPSYASYDPWGRRWAYTIQREGGGDIWLIRPKSRKATP